MALCNSREVDPKLSPTHCLQKAVKLIAFEFEKFKLNGHSRSLNTLVKAILNRLSNETVNTWVDCRGWDAHQRVVRAHLLEMPTSFAVLHYFPAFVIQSGQRTLGIPV